MRRVLLLLVLLGTVGVLAGCDNTKTTPAASTGAPPGKAPKSGGPAAPAPAPAPQ
jgi:hypothetical protein